MDGHADTLGRLEAEDRTLGGPSARGHSDLARLLSAGVSLQVLAVCTESEPGRESSLHLLLAQLERFYTDLEGRGEAFLVRERADLDRLGPGRVGFLLGLEGAAPLGGRAGMLRILFRLGVRLLGPVWNGRNDFGDGVAVAGGGGLTGKGCELARLAQDLGVLLDLAHMNEAGFWDLLAATEGPVVASHANARAVHDHRRNLSDAQIRALADRGGLVGVNLYPPFLTAAPEATIADVLRHVAHLLDVAGPNAVGLGLDFDGIEKTPVELPDAGALPRLWSALEGLGLDRSSLAKLLGGNWLRVLRQTLP
ncbi:MAG: dipeptidase [Patescibacteria group bacterium]